MLKYWLYLSAVSSITIAEVIDYHVHPQYSFEYGVNDPSTQDVKKQWETRDGDKVQGSYSFKEADGTVRVVEYHANDRTGFNAVVRREGHAVHPPTHHHEPVIYIPTRTHTTVHKVPVESHVHTLVRNPIHNPHHSYISSSMNVNYPKETVIYTPDHTTIHKPVHMAIHTSVNSQHLSETSIHTPIHTVLHTSVKSPVHITPVYTAPKTITHTTKTPTYAVVHHTKKTATPVETTVHVPVNDPEMSIHHTITKEVKERKEPEVYNSQIAGAHTASLISAIPQYYT